MTERAAPVIRAERLSFRVEDKQIVDDVSISVERGQVLAIVGPSGAGKSSFLRLLNRLDEPTGGTVYVEGQDYREIPPRVLRSRVGMVMQSAVLFPGSVADNIRFGPQQRGEDVPPEEIESLLAAVDLAGYGERGVGKLSGGEAQRVSLARTLANRPEVILLDEPTSALDESTQDEVEALICRIINERHLTCLIVTHDLDQAARMANCLMLMKAGKLADLGTPEEMLNAGTVAY